MQTHLNQGGVHADLVGSHAEAVIPVRHVLVAARAGLVVPPVRQHIPGEDAVHEAGI